MISILNISWITWPDEQALLHKQLLLFWKEFDDVVPQKLLAKSLDDRKGTIQKVDLMGENFHLDRLIEFLGHHYQLNNLSEFARFGI